MSGDATSSTSLPAGTILGGCRIVRFIDRGGMGEVYLAQHLLLERDVALKVLPPGKLDEERVARFLREARACSQIDHPNVVTIYDVGEENGQYFIAMKYVHGRNLTQIVKTQGGPLPWRTALKIMRYAVKGVEAVHQRGLLHRDIKPSNIMVGEDAQVVLMDFGLVREERSSELTTTGAILGTPVFMAREQCLGEKLDHRCDIYALGATLYYLLTGRLPYEGDPHSVMMQIAAGKKAAPVCRVNPFVPQPVSELVERTMDTDRRRRPQSARELGRSLLELLKQPDPVEPGGIDTTSVSAERTHDREKLSARQVVPELEPLRHIPTHSGRERWQRVLPWAVAGGLLTLFVAVGLILRVIFGTPAKKQAGVQMAQKTPQQTGGAAKARLPAGVDPKTMVRIPAGFVRLGNDRAQLRDQFDRLPRPGGVSVDEWERSKKRILEGWTEKVQRVYVGEFWIDKYEVTNTQYANFVQATGHAPPPHWGGKTTPPLDLKDHPVTRVNYEDAEAYARWAKKKLPTVEQWVRAFRGDSDQFYPWGNEWDATRANVLENMNFSRQSKTTPVTATPKDVSSFGVYNLVGNVRELCRGQFRDEEGVWYIIKGGKYSLLGGISGIGSARLLYLVTSKKPLSDAQDPNHGSLGFRCVVEVPGTKSP